MNDLRKAAQMALEALEYENDFHKHCKESPYGSTTDTIEALRAALAQPEQDLQLVANLLKEYGLEALEVIAALKTQPEQEPVAVVAMDVSGVHMSYGGQYLGQKPDTKIAMLLKDLPVGTHLYVAVGMGVSNE